MVCRFHSAKYRRHWFYLQKIDQILYNRVQVVPR